MDLEEYWNEDTIYKQLMAQVEQITAREKPKVIVKCPICVNNVHETGQSFIWLKYQCKLCETKFNVNKEDLERIQKLVDEQEWTLPSSDAETKASDI